jgi:CRISPR-associated endonuclease/helicase Cas3
MRGLERDGLPKDRIFARFLPAADRSDGAAPVAGTVYLVCTSAGEVGVNLSADHLICDLTTFESMAQRFGRVNRFGDRTDTEIHIVHPSPKKIDEKDSYEQRRKKTLELLQQLNGDASPAALSQLDLAARQAAFAPKPDIPRATDVLFDAWALTTIREELPGRPPVEPYLHGITERELPETYVAWREEVELLSNARLSDKQLGELLADYPLKPHELLRDRSDRVFKHLASLAKEQGEQTVWLIDDYGEIETIRLGELLENKGRINWMTVVLPPSMGGLAPTGTLGEGAPRERLDVADQWYQDGKQQRKRIWDDDNPPPYMRFVRTIDTNPEADEAEEETAGRRFWHWFVRPKSADDDGSKTASQDPVTWDDHTNQVTTYAKNIAAKLCLPPALQKVLELAGRFHDLGKRRERWQQSIGNPNPTDWHAKSGKDWKPWDITDYRHEFGSLLDVRDEADFQQLNDHMKDLVLHLIAAHHGRGRPHFPLEEAFDLEPRGKDVDTIAADVPRRFAQLQRKYGRWGLAYLESLLRAADYAASARPTKPSVTEGA